MPELPTFIPALELNRRFYGECVRPLLDEHFPGLAHGAALLGQGSEVLGFDTAMSMDHDWYPRLLLFLRQADQPLSGPIREMLAHHLPHFFLGFPVDCAETPEEPGTHRMSPHDKGPVQHGVTPLTLRAFADRHLNWDPRQPLEPSDWLSLSSQVLGTMVAGAVYHDGTGELAGFREQLAWYPHDVWLYLLAAGWKRIAQEEHLMPRAGFAGDELGSALIGARLVRDLMGLGFLMEKRYAPYPKWFGSAFQRLDCAVEMTPHLWAMLRAADWQARQAAFGRACQSAARMHNALGLTDPLSEETSPFFGRPFEIIQAERFVKALLARISDPQVLEILGKGLLGNLDQVSDNTELRSHLDWRPAVKSLFTHED
ncbi:MAG: DUF4037 domain-containing protein [Anaerolineales bacterium]|nr:DUF4037 domain-containing protein [Anaerolineales bacterium]